MRHTKHQVLAAAKVLLIAFGIAWAASFPAQRQQAQAGAGTPTVVPTPDLSAPMVSARVDVTEEASAGFPFVAWELRVFNDEDTCCRTIDMEVSIYSSLSDEPIASGSCPSLDFCRKFFNGQISVMHFTGLLSLRVDYVAHVVGCEDCAITSGEMKTLTQVTTRGEVNCDRSVDAIDSALILQLDAGLLPEFFCRTPGFPDLTLEAFYGDVNFDNRADTIDALLVLQYTAGLLSQFPP